MLYIDDVNFMLISNEKGDWKKNQLYNEYIFLSFKRDKVNQHKHLSLLPMQLLLDGD